MRRVLIIAVMLLAWGVTAFAQIDFDLPRPDVMDPATDPVRADSARVRAERKADALAAMALVPARLSSGTVIALYKSGDPNNVWGKYHDSVEAARDKAENDYYKKRTTVMTDSLDIGGLGYTAAQLEGMSEAEKQAFAIQARDAGLSEYGISMSDLKQGMTEDEAKKVVGKMMEAKYGGINMQELDQYMNADEKDRQKITKDALKERSDKTIRTETIQYLNWRIACKQQEIAKYVKDNLEPLYEEAEKKESIPLYCQAVEKTISACKGMLLELHLDLAALQDQGFAINRHAEYATREENVFFPVFTAFDTAWGESNHPCPDLK